MPFMIEGGGNMTRTFKNAWKAAALAVLLVMSAVSRYQGMSDLNMNPANGVNLARHRTVEKYCDIFAGPSREGQADIRQNRVSFGIFPGNASNVARRMNKDARIAMNLGVWKTWKAYVTDYGASISAGGKNAAIASAGILKEWRAAIRNTFYS
jgi:hypothetical protein